MYWGWHDPVIMQKNETLPKYRKKYPIEAGIERLFISLAKLVERFGDLLFSRPKSKSGKMWKILDITMIGMLAISATYCIARIPAWIMGR